MDLFDIVSKKYVARGISKDGVFTIPAKEACIIVELPAGTELSLDGKHIWANKQYIISYK